MWQSWRKKTILERPRYPTIISSELDVTSDSRIMLVVKTELNFTDALSTQVISSVVPADNFSGFAPLQPHVSQDAFSSPSLQAPF